MLTGRTVGSWVSGLGIGRQDCRVLGPGSQGWVLTGRTVGSWVSGLGVGRQDCRVLGLLAGSTLYRSTEA